MTQGQPSTSASRPEAAALDLTSCVPAWAIPACPAKELQMDFWGMVDGWNFRLLV